ncbi:cupin domain-containing protein [Agromyces archimandritae]|uniref:Cupin domain-containing protein n=1 Tax=Agromyces archimandritae TaxID=2781962 RepID=A0A975IMU1_9MICO|nr:cupin domain-containing protein [Agromyces archimandritae]QTX03529.1 cupin domain-containing protein [Agromyces archimandritae]
MTAYEVLEIGALDEWRDHHGGFRPDSARDGRRVVDHELESQYIGLTANALEPGEEAGYWHTHARIEELYVFLGGRGQMGLDDEVVEVGPGTVVRVGPGVARTWRAAPGGSEQLRWLCIRAGGTELPQFPDDSERHPERPMPWTA